MIDINNAANALSLNGDYTVAQLAAACNGIVLGDGIVLGGVLHPVVREGWMEMGSQHSIFGQWVAA